jgi:two-component system, OmpR family, sensor histidine kinase BaeS
VNRLVVRLLVAFLLIIGVTVVSTVGTLIFVLLLVARGIPQAAGQQIERLMEQSFESINFSLSAEENYILLALIFGSVIVAVVLAVLLARRIAAPLQGVSQAATRVALGEWDARALVYERGDSETARLVRDFNSMASTLEALETERKVSVAAIAHELRTPLTVLRGRLEAVRDGVLEANPAEYGLLIGQVELLSRLIADLRTLSLAEAGQLSLERRDADVAALLRSVGAAFTPRADLRGVRLEVTAPEALWLYVDAERVHQVIANLLENALRHTDHGFVRLSLEPGAKSVHLRVRDSGAGIPSEALGHVFERFYRAEGSRSRASGGSGLGLAVSQAIVTMHGGQIAARNHPDGGAELTVTLPRDPALEPPKSIRSRYVPQPSSKVLGDANTSSALTRAIYHGLSLPLSIMYLMLSLIGFALGVGLSIIWIGLPILLATFCFFGYVAQLERWLSDSLLGVPIPYTPRQIRGSLIARLGAALRDPMTWWSGLYITAKIPFALLSSLSLLALFSVSLALIAAPLIQMFGGSVLTLDDWELTTPLEATVASANLGAVRPLDAAPSRSHARQPRAARVRPLEIISSQLI